MFFDLLKNFFTKEHHNGEHNKKTESAELKKFNEARINNYQLFKEKLLYLYKNSDKILLLIYETEKSKVDINDLMGFLLYDSSLEQNFFYERFEFVINRSSFQEYKAAQRMECSIYLLDCLYHILEYQFEKLDYNADTKLEDTYELRFGYLTVALKLLQAVRCYLSMEGWFDSEEYFFSEYISKKYYNTFLKQGINVSESTNNKLVKQIYFMNEAIFDSRILIEEMVEEIKQIEMEKERFIKK